MCICHEDEIGGNMLNQFLQDDQPFRRCMIWPLDRKKKSYKQYFCTCFRKSGFPFSLHWFSIVADAFCGFPAGENLGTRECTSSD